MITKRNFLTLPMILALLSYNDEHDDNYQGTKETANEPDVKLFTNSKDIPVVISAQPNEGSMKFSLTQHKGWARKDWHSWFAWYPIRLYYVDSLGMKRESNQVVWWQCVERRQYFINGKVMRTDYKLPNSKYDDYWWLGK